MLTLFSLIANLFNSSFLWPFSKIIWTIKLSPLTILPKLFDEKNIKSKTDKIFVKNIQLFGMNVCCRLLLGERFSKNIVHIRWCLLILNISLLETSNHHEEIESDQKTEKRKAEIRPLKQDQFHNHMNASKSLCDYCESKLWCDEAAARLKDFLAFRSHFSHF